MSGLPVSYGERDRGRRERYDTRAHLPLKYLPPFYKLAGSLMHIHATRVSPHTHPLLQPSTSNRNIDRTCPAHQFMHSSGHQMLDQVT